MGKRWSVAGPGRGKKMLTAEQEALVRALVGAGASLRAIAARVGCSKTTASNYAGLAPRPADLRLYLVRLGCGL